MQNTCFTQSQLLQLKSATLNNLSQNPAAKSYPPPQKPRMHYLTALATALLLILASTSTVVAAPHPAPAPNQIYKPRDDVAVVIEPTGQIGEEPIQGPGLVPRAVPLSRLERVVRRDDVAVVIEPNAQIGEEPVRAPAVVPRAAPPFKFERAVRRDDMAIVIEPNELIGEEPVPVPEPKFESEHKAKV
ncbi:hypothetical protein MMC21_008377 [Puttea exsequens]|nr:hypothetical protein [Puttea exsequens]